ncbi:hypothetical protein GXW78_10270 [Roseomonas terrae]|uniref:Uncharacterized protein n=1 Tax=Neoroseomonas terrae TaxID=424799 RepID=A0ABS5EGA4_9PROT|nr:hypothetical protein [Neoroseomonas terrae]MBR0650047.1 hypothetical protein [Neoroseomonas terrae]
MNRRAILGLVGCFVALAGCASQPPDFSFGGAGFQPANTRLNLAYAERNFGDMSLYRGKPAEAAAALAQFEAAVAGMRDPATSIALPVRYGPQVAAAIREEREALGIPLTVLPNQVSAALAAAVGPLRSGDQAAIRTALSNPVFTLGPDQTLARLSNLPRMWTLESIAPILTRAAGTESGVVLR